MKFSSLIRLTLKNYNLMYAYHVALLRTQKIEEDSLLKIFEQNKYITTVFEGVDIINYIDAVLAA